MSRSLRIEYPGAFYHVTARGNERKAIFKAIGLNPSRFSVPDRPARFFAGVMEDTLRLVGRKSPIGRATIDKYTEDIAVSSQRIQTELGFQPQYDLRSGWQETVQEMRRMGEL
jgi:nucleoside-diphosphate-sugar epimerase